MQAMIHGIHCVQMTVFFLFIATYSLNTIQLCLYTQYRINQQNSKNEPEASNVLISLDHITCKQGVFTCQMNR